MENTKPLRSVLICHEADALDREAMTAWLASFSNLVGVVVLREPKSALVKRLKAELKRSGPLGLVDVFAFRAYYKAHLAKRDARALDALRQRVVDRYGRSSSIEQTFSSPNEPAARDYLASLAPDVVIARCKFILKPEVFTVARVGTFVLHPGICPEYRNAHGCFWALVARDTDKVGTTLLKVDKGIDTGPVYGYFTYDYDERRESHLVIQQRTIYENLDRVAARLQEIAAGTAQPVDTKGRRSAVFGQPHLTKYLRWKVAAHAKALG
jgi:folate-dependent phosphoribosylglycinamide formyltransferase PurN